MGTRADFYDSKDGDTATATWLGSVGWDGYPSGIDGLKESMTQDEWADLLQKQAQRKDWTAPERGWPWPWNDSQTTDFAYVRDSTGRVAAYCFGRPTKFAHSDEDEEQEKVAFPDMSAQKKVTLGPRSGLIVLGGGG